MTSSLVKSSSTTLYSMDEVARHKTEDDGWFVYENTVYDATNHLKEIKHEPGRTSTWLAIMRILGTDCTEEMYEINHSEHAMAQLRLYRIGTISESSLAP